VRFAVHGPGCPVASPRSHGVPRRDVPGRVYVGVAGVSAGGASEDGLALARLRVHLPARPAALAGIRGIDLLYPSGSFVLQAPHQQPPSGPQDLSIEPGLGPDILARVRSRTLRRPGHALNVEVLDPDQVEPASKARAGLLDPVFAPIRFPRAQLSDRVFHSCAAVRSAFGSGQPPLQAQQPLSLWCGQGWQVQKFPSRQGRGHCYAPIDAYGSTATDISGEVKRRSLPGLKTGSPRRDPDD
jgi:hypothetical protein